MSPTARPNPLDKELLTVHDMAKVYSVSVRTIWRWADLGKIPRPYHLTPSTVRWKGEEVRQHIEQVQEN